MAIGEAGSAGVTSALTEQLQTDSRQVDGIQATAGAVATAQVEPAVQVELLRTMQLIRRFEERAEELYLAGELPGFIHLSIGQEACAAGACLALRQDDYITSTHRGHGHCLAKGAQMKQMMPELYAKETGACKGKGGSMHIADFSVGMLGANGVVGGGGNLAVGAAIAARLRKTAQVALCFFGDGATTRGPVHEVMNLAAVWNLPVIFFCENNQWASTTSVKSVMKIEDIADRAAGYGMPGVVIDGNDVQAVYSTVCAWVERARRGGGPVLIEAKTYRMRGHFVGDPQVYRSTEEVEAQKANDPIERIAYAVKIREKSDFEMGTQRTNAALDPDPLFTLGWLENGPGAYGRAHVPEIQSCLDEGRASYDPAKRQSTYVRCQTMMYETAWWGYLWLQPWNYLFDKRVKNVPPMFATYWREEQMWLE